MDSLIQNSGTIIKKLACILFVIAILTTIVCAVTFGKDRYGDFNFWAFLGILVGVVLSSFISSVFLYAFGDITENIKTMAAASVEAAKATTQAAQATRAPVSTSGPASFSNSRATLGATSDTWVCKKCGKRNSKGSTYCMDCGEYR